MGERQVTVDGLAHSLVRPFIVLATQNPIEYEGTFPLPEAQLDCFLFKMKLGKIAARLLRARCCSIYNASIQAPTPAAPETSPQAAAPVAPAVPMTSPAAGQQSAVTPPAPTPPQSTPYARAAQEAGLQFEGLTDEQIASSMVQHIVRSRPYATYGQQMAPYADQIREYFDREKQPPQPTATPAASAEEGWNEEKYFAEKWAAPKWDDQYNFVIQQGMVQRNAETGLYEACPRLRVDGVGNPAGFARGSNGYSSQVTRRSPTATSAASTGIWQY